MSSVNYLVFLKNTKTQEEFTAPTTASKGAHHVAMQNIQKQYPTPQFQIHTAYSEDELKNALQSFDRWPGLNNSIKRTVSAPKDQKIAPMSAAAAGLSLNDAIKQATGAQVNKAPVQPMVAPQSAPTQPTPTQATSTKVAAQAPQMSVIDQLKALRQQS